MPQGLKNVINIVTICATSRQFYNYTKSPNERFKTKIEVFIKFLSKTALN